MTRTHFGSILAGAALFACGDGSVTDSAAGTTGDGTTGTSTTGTSTSGGNVPAVFQQFASTVQVSVEGDYVVLRATGVPNHKSPYFAAGDARYEAFNIAGKAFVKNPNAIETQSYVFRIPLNPKVASTHAATPLGPIGLAVNGVPLFNQYAGPNRPLADEIISFDQYDGHPSPQNQYHYHAEPYYLTTTRGASALVGFLLDGFPVYSAVENGKRVSNADLDTLHGHTHATAEYPNGIYHYHVTDADPYINGAGFAGTAGTVGR